MDFLADIYWEGCIFPKNFLESLRWASKSDDDTGHNDKFRKFFTYSSSVPFCSQEMTLFMGRDNAHHLTRLCYELDAFARFEDVTDNEICPILKPLFVNLPEFSYTLASTANILKTEPLLGACFSLKRSREQYLEEQFDPPFFHVFSYEGTKYLTLGEEAVQKAQQIESLLFPENLEFEDP